MIGVVENVGPAVVSITSSSSPGGVGPPAGAGSGFFFADDGYLITNDHVAATAVVGGLKVIEKRLSRDRYGQCFAWFPGSNHFKTLLEAVSGRSDSSLRRVQRRVDTLLRETRPDHLPVHAEQAIRAQFDIHLPE